MTQFRSVSIIWPLAIATAAVVGSLLAACTMPFVGVAVVAAATMNRSQALIAVIGAWLVNQLLGFGVLGYPADALTIAWGGVLGVASVAALIAARGVLRGESSPARLVAAFAAGFVANQAVLFAFALIVGGTADYTPAIEAQVLLINGVCVAGLLALRFVMLRAAPRVFAAPRIA